MRHGIVVAAQPEAAEAGARALEDGGNAIDAAVASALVQTVVDPQMSGIGGFGAMQVHEAATGEAHVLQFHATAPRAASETMWSDRLIGETRDGFGFTVRDHVNELGHAAIGVPGTLAGLERAMQRFGSMDWGRVVAPAIEQAECGCLVRPHVYTMWNVDDAAAGRVNKTDKLAFTEAGRAIYFRPDGSLKRPGDTLHNPDMARTLRRVAEGGAAVLYGGDLGAEIAADIQAHGGLLTLEDLEGYAVREERPLTGRYRGLDVSTTNVPTAGCMVLEMLHVLEHFDLAAMGWNSPDTIATVAEAMKQAVIDKNTHVGDAAGEIDFEQVFGEEHARAVAERIRRGEQAVVELVRGPEEPPGTTQVTTLDAAGNVAVLTHTLGTPSGVITRGHGIMFNGAMAGFDPRPGRPNSIRPGRARFSSVAPTIVLDAGAPMLALGAPGATAIPNAIVQTIVNVVDFAMPVLDAVLAPRFNAVNAYVGVSNRIPRYVTEVLEARGYRVQRSHESYAFAAVHAILSRDGVASGAADPQRDGVALVV